jgi:hypothetical protein
LKLALLLGDFMPLVPIPLWGWGEMGDRDTPLLAIEQNLSQERTLEGTPCFCHGATLRSDVVFKGLGNTEPVAGDEKNAQNESVADHGLILQWISAEAAHRLKAKGRRINYLLTHPRSYHIINLWIRV